MSHEQLRLKPVESGQWGLVLVVEGDLAGQLGYYDDEDDGRAIVVFNSDGRSPIRPTEAMVYGQRVIVPLSGLRMLELWRTLTERETTMNPRQRMRSALLRLGCAER